MPKREKPRKKRKRTQPEEELVCPITLILPWDPVHADDGRVYERSAIETYFNTCHDKGTHPRSPITNEEMGSRLLPAPHIKNIIEKLIHNGEVTSDLSSKWLEKAEAKRAKDAMLAKARRGDVRSMNAVGFKYRFGADGFDMDPEASHTWFLTAHEAGCTKSTACVGMNMCRGYGVEANIGNGIVFVATAAAQGSSFAAFKLGVAFASGSYGLSVDNKSAKQWLGKCLNAKDAYDDLTAPAKTQARNILKEIETSSDANN